MRESFVGRTAVRRFVLTTALLVFGAAGLSAQQLTCHNEKLNTAGLKLDRIRIESVRDDAPAWEKVINKLRTGAMPPPGVMRPSDNDYNSTATYLETELDRLASENPNPGSPVIHCLTRAEYSNAVRDLLGIDTNAIDIGQLLPADERQGKTNLEGILPWEL